MLDPAGLLEVHRRTHVGTSKLLDHCRSLSDEERLRELPGFGYSTVHQQLGHIISCEEYWIMVVQDKYIPSSHLSGAEEEEGAAYPTIDALEQYRSQTAAATAAYLHSTTVEELGMAREFMTWPENRRVLVPVMVVMRVLTHVFHHRGQIAAMCRLLGHPVPGGILDFPILP
jgi:uncharacterized damage-inducible protein DinB